MTRLASVQSRDRELLHGAAHGIPETDFDLVFQVATWLMLRLHPGVGASTAEKLAEEITEARSTASWARSAKIKSAKIKIHTWLARIPVSRITARWQILAIEAVLVVHLPLLRVGEHVIGFLQLLEFLF